MHAQFSSFANCFDFPKNCKKMVNSGIHAVISFISLKGFHENILATLYCRRVPLLDRSQEDHYWEASNCHCTGHLWQIPWCNLDKSMKNILHCHRAGSGMQRECCWWINWERVTRLQPNTLISWDSYRGKSRKIWQGKLIRRVLFHQDNAPS